MGVSLFRGPQNAVFLFDSLENPPKQGVPTLKKTSQPYESWQMLKELAGDVWLPGDHPRELAPGRNAFPNGHQKDTWTLKIPKWHLDTKRAPCGRIGHCPPELLVGEFPG